MATYSLNEAFEGFNRERGFAGVGIRTVLQVHWHRADQVDEGQWTWRKVANWLRG